MADSDFVQLNLEPATFSAVTCSKCGATPTILLPQGKLGPVSRGWIGCRCGVFVGIDHPDALKQWFAWQLDPAPSRKKSDRLKPKGN